MTIHRRLAVPATIVAGALLLCGCTSAEPRETPPPRVVSSPVPTASAEPREGWWAPSGDAGTLVGGLAAPWSIVAFADGSALISERDSGTVREMTAGGELRTAGEVPGAVSGGESGLHGLAVRTDDDGAVWLYAYHGSAEDNRVVRMPLLGEPGARRLGAVEDVFTGIPRGSTHNGGRIAFGPDGMLYVATGDAQNRPTAQDPGELGGKILRLTPEGAAAPGNPGGGVVWSLGHRNVQGLAWTADGRMWASEFGQDSWDELNLIEAGGNYGWPEVEGVAGDDRFVDPVQAWRPAEASPSGIAAVGSTVFMTGLRGERLWAVDIADDGTLARSAAVLDGQGRLRDVVAAADGALWILTNNTDGRGSPREGDDILLRLPIASAG